MREAMEFLGISSGWDAALILSSTTVRGRLGRLLHHRLGDANAIEIQATQQLIASAIRCSRESMCRELKKLSLAGIDIRSRFKLRATRHQIEALLASAHECELPGKMSGK